MARKPHPDRPRINAAFRLLWLALDGNLPSDRELQRALLGARVKTPAIRDTLSEVLTQQTVSLRVIGQCRKQVEVEFQEGKLIVDRDVLSTSPRIAASQVWADAVSGEIEDRLLDDDAAEVWRLNLIHRAVFGAGMPQLAVTMAKRLHRSLEGLEPVAALFLLLEYPVRRAIYEKIRSDPRASIAENARLPTFKDVDALVALRPWASSQAGGTPWELLARDDIIPQLRFQVFKLEPLCLPEWENVRLWLQFALLNKRETLAENPHMFAWNDGGTRRTNVTWESIMRRGLEIRIGRESLEQVEQRITGGGSGDA